MWVILAAILGSSVLAAVVTQVGNYLLQRRKRKDEVEDRESQSNGAIVARLDRIERKLDCHIEQDGRDKADAAREKILTFGDAVRNGVRHSMESWHNVLEQIDKYEDYCADNPTYPNTKAVATIDHLKDLYADRLEKNDFL